MKHLSVLRHAKSDWDDMALRDFDRGLNARGRRGAALMGRHIIEHGIAWEMILASPSERVRRTLEASGLEVPVRWEAAAYLADAETLMGLIAKVPGDPLAVLVSGHNPGLQELILELAVPNESTGVDGFYKEVAVKFPTASFAVLELAIGDWTEIAPGCGSIVHFARPRDLDPELGPEKGD